MFYQDLQNERKKQNKLLLRSAALTAAFLFLAAGAVAQVVPAGYQDQPRLSFGVEYSNFSASFPYQSGQRIGGLGGFADLTLKSRLGVEGEVRFLHFGGFEGSTESNYLAGPRYLFRSFGNFRPYIKGLVGSASIHYPFQIGDASYLAVAPAGGVSYRLSGSFALRAEYEYQFWLNSPGYANEPHHELMPNGVQIGIAYSIFR